MAENNKRPKSPSRNKYPLSSQILDYYYKYGQNRDLEKYLKVHKCHSHSKSSSDSSLQSPKNTESISQLGKSLDNLNILKTTKISDGSKSYNSGKSKSLPKELLIQENLSPKVDQNTSKCDEELSNEKAHIRKESKISSKAKSYHINIESNVEIALPKQFCQSAFVGTVNPNMHLDKSPFVPQIYRNVSPEINIPVNRDLQLGEKEQIPTEFSEIARPSSPASSIASNKKNLEWDSLADIGYEYSPSAIITSSTPMSSLEKCALEKFFAQRGISMDNNIILLSPQSKKKEIKSPNETKIKTMPVDEDSLNDSENLQNVKKNAEKWQNLLKKLNENKKASNKIGTRQKTYVKELEKLDVTDSDAHLGYSTHSGKNITEIISLKKITNDDKSNSISEDAKVDRSSQTHSIEQSHKSIQVLQEIVKDSEAELVNADSFEFLPAAEYKRQKSNKENISPLSSGSSLNEQIEDMLFDCFHSASEKENHKDSNDIKQAIRFINLLFDSNKISKVKKKELVQKILLKLMQPNSRNVKKNSDSVSNISSKKSSNGNIVVTCEDSSSKTDKLSVSNRNSLMKQWLKPMTHSELDYELHAELEQRKIDNNMSDPTEMPKGMQRSTNNNGSNHSVSSNSVSNRNEYLKREKHLQLKCIDKEIACLEKIKKLLIEGKINSQDNGEVNKIISNSYQSKGNSSDTANSYEKQSEIEQQNGKITSSNQRSSKFSEWNSHQNLQFYIKNRSKLQTPSLDDNLIDFVQQRKRQFAAKYEEMHKLFADTKSLYTNPCSSKYYSEPLAFPNNESCSNSEEHRQPFKIDASTSINSSEVFLSSDSMTIPELCSGSDIARSKEAATKQQVAGTQTTDSIILSAPIYGPEKVCNCKNPFGCYCAKGKHTVLVDKTRNNKQQQTKPKALAYIIMLSENKSQNLQQQKEKAQIIEIEPHIQRSHESDLSQFTTNINKQGNYLQDCLLKNRPHFYQKAQERKKYIEDIKYLRKERNTDRAAILSSRTLMKTKLNSLLKSPIIKSKNLSRNSSRIYKEQSKRKYKRLPEVVRKQEKDKNQAYRTNTKLIADIFNKNLQRNVLKGKINLRHSKAIVGEYMN